MANRSANMAKINQIQQLELIRRQAGVGARPRPVPPPAKKGKKRPVHLGPQRVIFNPPGPAPTPSISHIQTQPIPTPAAVPHPTISAPPPTAPNKIIAPRTPFGGAAATHPGRGHLPQDATKPLTAAQKKQIDAADKAQFGPQLGPKVADADKTVRLADRSKADEANLAKVEKYRRDAEYRARQRKADELSSLTGIEQLARAAEGIPQDTSIFLEGLPAPGGVALPLLLLLVLFLLVVPVKGADGAIHTRAMWLWRVVTGNASLALTAQQGTAQAFPGTPPPAGVAVERAIEAGVPFAQLPFVQSLFPYSLGETP